ncbi:MAG: hypothetical protein ACYC0L_02170 [Thermoleophilia bacterium]
MVSKSAIRQHFDNEFNDANDRLTQNPLGVISRAGSIPTLGGIIGPACGKYCCNRENGFINILFVKHLAHHVKHDVLAGI